MMLIHVALGYVTFALAYPSSNNPIWQSTPVSDLQLVDKKSVQTLNEGVCFTGPAVSTSHKEALNRIRSKIFPTPVEDISSLLLSYAEAGDAGRWNITVKQTKRLLDSLTVIITQDDSHVLDLDTKIKLQELSTTFLDQLP